MCKAFVFVLCKGDLNHPYMKFTSFSGYTELQDIMQYCTVDLLMGEVYWCISTNRSCPTTLPVPYNGKVWYMHLSYKCFLTLKIAILLTSMYTVVLPHSRTSMSFATV